MVKHIALSALAVSCFILLSAPAFSRENEQKEVPDPVEMSLSDCVQLVIRKNRDIESAYLDRVVQKYNLKVEEDKFTPKLTLNPSIAKSSTTIDGDRQTDTSVSGSVSLTELASTGAQLNVAATRTIDRIKGGGTTARNSTWSLAFSQPLLKGGGLDVNTASVRTARINEKINILSLKSILIDKITSVISSFRSLLLATYQLDISRKSLERARELVEVNRELITAGRMAEVEIVQTEADVSDKELDLLESENELDLARLALIKLLDIDKSTRIIPMEKISIEPARLEYEELKGKALENRPDYRSALMNLEISRISLMLAVNNRLWDLSLTGGYDGGDITGVQPGLSFDSRGWNVGINLTIPLRLGFPVTDLTLQQGYVNARISLDKAEISLRDLRETIEVEIQDAIRDVDIKLKQARLARQSRALAEKKLDIEKEKMKAGRSSNFQLVTYQNDLVNAQNNEIRANISYLNALANLDKTIGTTLERWDIKVVDRYDEGYVR